MCSHWRPALFLEAQGRTARNDAYPTIYKHFMVNRATSVPVNAPLDPVSGGVSVPGPGPAQTISAVLVDDEKLASDELTYLLKEFSNVEVIAVASNGIEAVK